MLNLILFSCDETRYYTIDTIQYNLTYWIEKCWNKHLWSLNLDCKTFNNYKAFVGRLQGKRSWFGQFNMSLMVMQPWLPMWDRHRFLAATQLSRNQILYEWTSEIFRFLKCSNIFVILTYNLNCTMFINFIHHSNINIFTWTYSLVISCYFPDCKFYKGQSLL